MRSFSFLATTTLVALVASAFAPPPAPKTPDKSDKPTTAPIAKVTNDWTVEVVAKSPKLRWPSVVCCAPDGRIFIGEDPMDMTGPGNKPIDRILCIHPDGQITVFADQLYAVFGMAYIDGKLYVHHSPKVSVFTDEESVGKNRVDLIDSDNNAPWGGGKLNDHIPAQIRLAMDGYLYMAVGDKGIFGAVSNVDKRKAELRGGGILRIRPDGTDMEVYCTGTRNHLDISINAEDEMFTYDNTDDGQGWNTRFTHMVDGGYYAYPYDYRPLAKETEAMNRYKNSKGALPTRPWTLWRMEDYGGGSPTGAIAYNEDALPEEYRGNLFHCEWGKRQVARFIVKRDGATYKVAKREEFVGRNGPELRPIGICITPDGMGFYVSDWNFGGWNNKADAGRLLKVTYTGKSLAAPKPSWFVQAAQGKPFDASTAQLVGALSHPAQSVRLVAQRRAAERGAECVPLLVSLLKDSKAPPYARWMAIWTLDRIDAGKAGCDAIVDALKNSNDLTVRMQAARQLGTRRAAEAAQALIAALNDPDAAMRFRAATALGRIGETAAVQPLIDHLTEKDFFTHYAMFTALNRVGRSNARAWEMIAKGLESDKPEVREGVAFAMRETYDEALAKALTDFAQAPGKPPEARAAALMAMAPLFKLPKPWGGGWWGTHPVQGKPPAKEIEWAATEPIRKTLAGALVDPSAPVRVAAIDCMQIASDASFGAKLTEMFEAEQDSTVRRSILKSLAAAKSDTSTGLIVKILKDPAANAGVFTDALAVAQQVATPPLMDAIRAVVDMDTSDEAVTASIQTLAKLHDGKSVNVIAKRIAGKDAALAASAAGALGSIPVEDSARALVRAMKDDRPEVRRAAALSLGALKSSTGFDSLLAAVKNDADIRKEATIALANMPDIRALEAFLEGLAGTDIILREKCKRAIGVIHEKALPAIEKRMETNPLAPQVVDDLQRLFAQWVPAPKRMGKLWDFDTKSISPEAFEAFAKSHPGDADNGRKIFLTNMGTACFRCHRVGEEGGDVGPVLNGVGSKYNRAELIDSILRPSKQILDGYQQVKVIKKNGDMEVGIIRGETATELTLVESSGEKVVVSKSQIESRKPSEVSLMPEGVFTALKLEEFADLIAFLESLKDKH